MNLSTQSLEVALLLVALWYVLQWLLAERRQRTNGPRYPSFSDSVLGLVTNFLDTLGIGSFAPTTAAFKLWRRLPDEAIPGTLNVGHALPTLVESLIFIATVTVDRLTLICMIGAAVTGGWFGAGIVSRLPRRGVRLGMGVALLGAALVFLATNLHWLPGGGVATGLFGRRLAFAVAANFGLGALMTLGVGLYAPCLIVVSLLGMNPLAAFPIMMASSALLMPIAGSRFIRSGRYSLTSALGLTVGGIPGVLIAAFLVRSLPLEWLRWLVFVVVVYTGTIMFFSRDANRIARPIAEHLGERVQP